MKGQLEIMKTLGIKPNFSELERTFAVSYTHLDVYKRQVLVHGEYYIIQNYWEKNLNKNMQKY